MDDIDLEDAAHQYLSNLQGGGKSKIPFGAQTKDGGSPGGPPASPPPAEPRHIYFVLSDKIEALRGAKRKLRRARNASASNPHRAALTAAAGDASSEIEYCELKMEDIRRAVPVSDPGQVEEAALLAAIAAVGGAATTSAAINVLMGAVRDLIAAYKPQ